MVGLSKFGSNNVVIASRKAVSATLLALFVSSWLCFLAGETIGTWTFGIVEDPGTTFGTALLNNVDIGARVRLFYGFLVAFAFVFWGLRLIFLKAFSYVALSADRELAALVLPIAGCLSVFLSVMGIDARESSIFFAAASAAFLVWHFTADRLASPGASVWGFLFATCAAALLGLTVLHWTEVPPPLEIWQLLSVGALAILLFARRGPIPSLLRQPKLALLITGALLAVIPLETEIRALLRHRLGVTVPLWGAGLCAMLLVFSILRLSGGWSLRGRSVAAFSAGAGLLASAYRMVPPVSYGLFEEANYVLPVQQLFEYGRLPLLEVFPSHLLSDFSLPLLHALLHGYRDLTMLAWEFWGSVAAGLITFLFISRYSASVMVAVIVVLIAPFSARLVPPAYSGALLIPLLALRKTGEVRLVLLPVLFALLSLWRIDVGAGVAGGCALLLAGNALAGRLKFTPAAQKLIAGCCAVFIPLAAFALVASWWRQISLTGAVTQALDYFSSSQAYGYPLLIEKVTPLFRFHYFVIPALVIMSAMLCMQRLRRKGHVSYRAASLLFLCGFYLANFQRGLVRHSFLEETDIFLSSFAFLILAGVPLLIGVRRSTQLAFTGLSLALPLLFSLPYPHTARTPLNNALLASIEERPAVDAGPDAAIIEQTGRELFQLIDTMFPAPATFLDLTNSPLLYYFTHRESPGFFAQNLQTLHSVTLQQKFVRDLSRYDIPVVVFGRIGPRASWNFSDNIPNTLAYRSVSAHIFKNYKPWTTPGLWSLWLRKDLIPPDAEKLQHLDLHIPLSVEDRNGLLRYPIAPAIRVPGGYRLLIRMAPLVDDCSRLKSELQMEINGKTAALPLLAVQGQGPRECLFYSPRLSAPRAITALSVRDKLRALPEASSYQIVVEQYRHLPELFSQAPRHDDLRYLPSHLAKSRGRPWSGSALNVKESRGYIALGRSPAQSGATGDLALEFSSSSPPRRVTVSFGKGRLTLGSMSFEPLEKQFDVIVPLGGQPLWWTGEPEWITVDPSATVKQALLLED